MLDKYRDRFEAMYEDVCNGDAPNEVARRYLSDFTDEGIGELGLSAYLGIFIQNQD